MTEPTDLELVDHFLGRGPDDARRRLDAQLTQTPELKRRYDDLAATWELLGAAEVSLAQRDLWDGVAAKLQYQPSRLTVLAPIFRAPFWARAAAAVVVATCVGYGTAQLHLGLGSGAVQPVDVAEAEVAEQLGLAAFEGGTIRQLAEGLTGTSDSTE
jgi:anti-sigma factor RsiW